MKMIKAMNVKINSEKELEELTRELLHILVNLRYWTKLWNEQYGSNFLKKKKLWEDRADKCLERIELTKTVNQNYIEFKINKDV